ncbi:NifU N-terminal domain-containing protein [Oceanobacillus alkalisoli]|uniref:NifU N-terminal domain-containing protein n=1 Tax=Oceanobacillus alkalisoli TaxID=2925113 RepID=UPI001EF151AB|nr:NifU N-terminal domain-containing protein [Oceanobacillus alkalisoli]MCF3942059.1 NifU N-terminal domain-containing protein [Oceanobacillus alkalisoli]MCG5101988.1 NifU N-terminal domain-containing protein [Oceanobacillus alkalisoli]
MAIRMEGTPNPNAMKFTSDKMIFEGTKSYSLMPGDTSEYDILNELMTIEGVDNVFGYQNFITVNKHFDVEWEQLSPHVIEMIEKHGY